MKKIILTLLTILLVNSTFSQSRERYSELINDAVKLHADKEYLNAGCKFSEAFDTYSPYAQVGDRYKAACAWALANQADSAFVQLFYIVHLEDFSDLNIIDDADLSSLHPDERWNFIIDIVKGNYEKTGKLDRALSAKLDSIYREDRLYRLEIDEMEQKYGRNSKEVQELFSIMNKKNADNVVEVTKILDKRGWLGPDIIGERGSKTLFLVMQRADVQTQENYFHVMEKAVQKGDADPADLALLEDRIALKQGKPQIYGSQIGIDIKTGKYYVIPIEDPYNVDERRIKVGLGKYKDYLSIFGLTWNVDEYVKELPELKTKHGIK
ncbi:MAG: hypothetical protein LBK94_12545 [Prevotellaceae bacterium]|jgi:hypothetical protein|nr:hypothetical protein [Prevotellaceae bacterium]